MGELFTGEHGERFALCLPPLLELGGPLSIAANGFCYHTRILHIKNAALRAVRSPSARTQGHYCYPTRCGKGFVFFSIENALIQKRPSGNSAASCTAFGKFDAAKISIKIILRKKNWKYFSERQKKHPCTNDAGANVRGCRATSCHRPRPRRGDCRSRPRAGACPSRGWQRGSACPDAGSCGSLPHAWQH